MYVALLSKSLAKIKEKPGKTFQLKLNGLYTARIFTAQNTSFQCVPVFIYSLCNFGNQ
jgi:hypothetical protein